MSANRVLQRRRPLAQRGLSIIELMVGLVVALLVSIAASGSAMMFTALQRQGIGAGGTAINSTTALASVKNDAALAGLGFFGSGAFLCPQMNLSTGATVQFDGAAFVPVRLTEDPGNNDRVDLFYSSAVESGANVLLNAVSDGTTADLMSYLPAVANQAILIAPKAVGDPCVMRTVTAVTPSTEFAAQRLAFDNTGLHNQAAFTAPLSYVEQSHVMLTGNLTWHRYRLNNWTLLMERPLLGDSVVLARNVIALRMQYGVSTAAGQSTLDSWQDATGAFAVINAATLPRVRALRIGMVTRSPQREKENSAGNCEATTAMPTLFGEATVADVADWQCYRYRSTTVVVPLRNLVYGMK